MGGWWRLAAVDGWRLVVVGGWWRLAVVGSWRFAVGGPLGRSLRAVLNKKKIWSLKDRPVWRWWQLHLNPYCTLDLNSWNWVNMHNVMHRDASCMLRCILLYPDIGEETTDLKEMSHPGTCAIFLGHLSLCTESRNWFESCCTLICQVWGYH